MQPYNQIPEGSGARSFMDAIETKIRKNQARFYRGRANQYMDARTLRLWLLRRISTVTAQRIREAAYILAIQVSKYLGDEILHFLAYYVSNLDYLVITRSTGTNPVVYGFNKRIGKVEVITLALKRKERKLTEFEIAATLFHELVHSADPNNNKLNINGYHERYLEYSLQGKLDAFSEFALRDNRELVARTFE